MPTRHTRQLATENYELREQNRRLRERIAWSVMQLRHCAEQALASISELEAAVVGDADAQHAAG